MFIPIIVPEVKVQLLQEVAAKRWHFRQNFPHSSSEHLPVNRNLEALPDPNLSHSNPCRRKQAGVAEFFLSRNDTEIFLLTYEEIHLNKASLELIYQIHIASSFLPSLPHYFFYSAFIQAQLYILSCTAEYRKYLLNLLSMIYNTIYSF